MKLRRILTCGIILITVLATSTVDAASYKRVYSKWTKSDRSYEFNSLDANLIWRAMMLNNEMIDAQVRFLEDKNIRDEIGLLKRREELADCIAFAVDLYSVEGLKGFSTAPNSIWKIYLIGADGEETPPANIQPITVTATHRALYPDMTKWSRLYLVEFPKIDLGHRPKLVIRSVAAESTLKWKMK